MNSIVAVPTKYGPNQPKTPIWKIETEGRIRLPCQGDGYEGDNRGFNYVTRIITNTGCVLETTELCLLKKNCAVLRFKL